MKRVFIDIIVVLLIGLFVYAAVSKLIELETFKRQMLNQPLPQVLARQLVWALPLAELFAVYCLLRRSLRMLGMLVACGLMTVFTVYVWMILIHVFERVPCSCGGVLESLSWEDHFVLNVVFWMLSLVGVILVGSRSGKEVRVE